MTSFEEYENIDSWVHKAIRIPIACTCSWAAWITSEFLRTFGFVLR